MTAAKRGLGKAAASGSKVEPEVPGSRAEPEDTSADKEVRSAKVRPLPDGRVRVVPSLLAADFGDLRGSLARLAAAGCEWASVDVMDGHFVPNLSFGPDLIPALRKGPPVLIDAHLMVSDPQKFCPVFARAGADWVTFHWEACQRPRTLIRSLRALGVGVGMAIKPETPAKVLLPYLGELDLVLVMTVEPGFGGQGFLSGMLPKIRGLRAAMDRAGAAAWLQVDGGITLETAALAAGAGADSLVAGSAIFKAPDPVSAMRAIGRRAQESFLK